MKTIGDRLKEARKCLKKSQQDFADTIGVKRSTYTGYENGAEVPSYVFMSLHWRYLLNIDYLKSGVGDMFDDSHQKGILEGSEEVKNVDIPSEVFSFGFMNGREADKIMLETLSILNANIRKLEAENEDLRRRLDIK